MGVPLELTRPGAPPPDLIDEVLRTELPPRGDDSSEFRDMLEPEKVQLFNQEKFLCLDQVLEIYYFETFDTKVQLARHWS